MGQVSSVWSKLKCYKQDKSKSLVSCETVASKDMNMEDEEAMVLEAIIR
jgi:hypothetical protein